MDIIINITLPGAENIEIKWRANGEHNTTIKGHWGTMSAQTSSPDTAVKLALCKFVGLS